VAKPGGVSHNVTIADLAGEACPLLCILELILRVPRMTADRQSDLRKLGSKFGV
jgi:hypothetical protein